MGKGRNGKPIAAWPQPAKVFQVKDDKRNGLLLLAHASKNLRAKHDNVKGKPWISH